MTGYLAKYRAEQKRKIRDDSPEKFQADLMLEYHRHYERHSNDAKADFEDWLIEQGIAA